MVLEPPGGLAGAEVPEPQVLVPGAGEGEVSVRGENYIGHEVRVSVEPLLGHSVLTVLTGQLPHDQGLVAAAGQDHVRILGVGGDLGHPSVEHNMNIRLITPSLLTRYDP